MNAHSKLVSLTDTEIAAARLSGTLCPECEGKCYFSHIACNGGCCTEVDPCDYCDGAGVTAK